MDGPEWPVRTAIAFAIGVLLVAAVLALIHPLAPGALVPVLHALRGLVRTVIRGDRDERPEHESSSDSKVDESEGTTP